MDILKFYNFYAFALIFYKKVLTNILIYCIIILVLILNAL